MHWDQLHLVAVGTHATSERGRSLLPRVFVRTIPAAADKSPTILQTCCGTVQNRRMLYEL